MNCFREVFKKMKDVSEAISDITDKEMEEMADCIEMYINDYDRYIIKEGISRDEYNKARKTVKKLIKKLRKHERSVFNNE